MNPARTKENLIVQLTFDFGLAVMAFCEELFAQRKFVIANQLLRSALSIGANVREAQNAESKADFVHKLKIACKEGDESEFYLELLEKAYAFDQTPTLLSMITSINKILNRIIATAQTNQKKAFPK